MNWTACIWVLPLLLVPAAAADHEAPTDGTRLQVEGAVPDRVEVYPGFFRDTLGPYTPEPLHPALDLLDTELWGIIYSHCGGSALTEGQAGLQYEPGSRHLTVFVSYALLDPYMETVGTLLPSAPPSLPALDFLATIGAGADVGVCQVDGTAGGPVRIQTPLAFEPSGEPITAELLGIGVYADPQKGNAFLSTPEGVLEP